MWAKTGVGFEVEDNALLKLNSGRGQSRARASAVVAVGTFGLEEPALSGGK